MESWQEQSPLFIDFSVKHSATQEDTQSQRQRGFLGWKVWEGNGVEEWLGN